MHPSISVRQEGKRGCGYRRVGGLYLVSRGFTEACGRLPIPLHSCPCCGSGIKPARGWTWVSAPLLLRDAPPCKHGQGAKQCQNCIVEGLLQEAQYPRSARLERKAGLLWVGEAHYPSIREFIAEAEDMGISRRVSALPRGFVAGETPVLLAHRKGVVEWTVENSVPKPVEAPAIFAIFIPSAVEVIVSGDESDDEIESMLERGLTPVLVKRIEHQPHLHLEDAKP